MSVLGAPLIVQGYRVGVILGLDNDWDSYLLSSDDLNTESLLLLEIARRIGSRYEVSLGPSFTEGCREEEILSTLYLHAATGDIVIRVVRLESSSIPHSIVLQAEAWSTTTAARKINGVSRILRGVINSFTRQAISKWPVVVVKGSSEQLIGVRMELENLADSFPSNTITELMRKAIVAVTYEVARVMRAPLTRISSLCSSQSSDALEGNIYHERAILEVDIGKGDNVVVDIAARYQETPLLAELVVYIADRVRRRRWMRLARILAGRIYATLYEALGES